MTKDYDSRVELSDNDWSDVMDALRYKAYHDDQRARKLTLTSGLAHAFRSQATAARTLANRIEETY